VSRLHPINYHDGEDILIGRERERESERKKVRNREVGRKETEESKKVRE
jgi:hypothetical protein